MTGKIRKLREGGFEYTGYKAFTTTGATVELDVPTVIKRITAFSLAYVGSPAAAESPLSIDEVTATASMSNEVTIPVPSDGNVTVRRPAGTTTGIGFFFRIQGHG